MLTVRIEDEEKWLAEGIAGIQHNAFYMHQALDSDNLKETLKFSALMLSELRTSKLSPHRYYELYMRAFDELRMLEVFFKDSSRHGLSIFDLYELVQHAGNILPRLYLLCTVGSVYMKSKEVPAKEVLKDLVEMCRGVQHPLRGLFLRNYLAQVSRDILLDIGSEYDGDADTVMEAVEFVLQNFTEMNKLWVRIQLQGPARLREKQEKERSELRDLVGKNLHVLSQIEGVDLEMYKHTVLPRVLEQVVNCKDELAQLYLMDCIIQVFPDEYHLQTLETLLGVCPQLQATVDIRMVLSQLMERLSNYAVSNVDVIPEFLHVEAFSKLSNAIGKVIEAQVDMPIVGAITLYVSLLTFTLRVHPDRLDYVDQILGACVQKLSGQPKLEDTRATKQIVILLSAPLEKYNDIVTALTLSNYPRVMDHLDIATNKVMAMVIIQSIMKNNSCISTADKVDVLFELIKGLITDMEEITVKELDEEDFKEEQNSVARLLHMLHNDDPVEMLKIICAVKKHILSGGPNRLPFTIPPLIFSALSFIRRLQKQDGDVLGEEQGESGDVVCEEMPATPKKVFQLLNQLIEALFSVPAPELALRLYLECAEAANDCNLEPIAYEFFTQAFLIYEEEIADSKAQVTAIHLIIGTLQRMNVFGMENRDTLTHKATGYSAKLLKKPDQCRAVYACSHLFWVDDPEGIKDGERVLLCLKRALRIANAAQQMASVTRGSSGPVTLFVEILNKYLYFFEKGSQQITAAAIQGLVELITTELQTDFPSASPASDAFFTSTLRYIQFQKLKGGAMSERYDSIEIGLDGIRMLDPNSSRTLRIYPLETITRCEVSDSSTLAFWSKSSVDIEPRRIRLQSNSYTTNTLLDTVTAATVQFKEMGGRSRPPDSFKTVEQPTEKKKGIVDWVNMIKPGNEEKDHWVPDEAVSKCTACGTDFGAFVRKHHCRNCGDIFCDKCTHGRIALTAEENAPQVRVCDRCLAEVTQRLSNAKEMASKPTGLQSHEDLAKKLKDEMEKNRRSSGSKSDGSGRRMKEVACPTCTVHLQVQVPSSGSETIECGVCQHPFLVSAH